MELKEIVNIFPDEKVIDYYIKMSETYIFNKSTFIVLTNKPELELIKSKNLNILVLKDEELSYTDILKNLQNVKVIIFHSFKINQQSLILKLPNHLTKIWIFWGFEGYKALPLRKYIGKKSLLASFNKSSFNLLKLFYVLYFNNKKNIKISKKIIRNFDYCATWIENDFLIAKTLNNNIKRVHFNYYSNELMNFKGIDSDVYIDKNKLFLGNSADPFNNHIEALSYLKKINFKGSILCPISYGGNETYKLYIIKLGEKFFKEKFEYISEFMPLKDYNNKVNSCGIIWMNHYRQQAAGNLIMGFYSKKIVITSNKNPMNSTFNKMGITLYKKNILKELNLVDSDSLNKNKKIILQEISLKRNEPYFEFLKYIQ